MQFNTYTFIHCSAMYLQSTYTLVKQSYKYVILHLRRFRRYWKIQKGLWEQPVDDRARQSSTGQLWRHNHRDVTKESFQRLLLLGYIYIFSLCRRDEHIKSEGCYGSITAIRTIMTLLNSDVIIVSFTKDYISPSSTRCWFF